LAISSLFPEVSAESEVAVNHFHVVFKAFTNTPAHIFGMCFKGTDHRRDFFSFRLG